MIIFFYFFADSSRKKRQIYNWRNELRPDFISKITSSNGGLNEMRNHIKDKSPTIKIKIRFRSTNHHMEIKPLINKM